MSKDVVVMIRMTKPLLARLEKLARARSKAAGVEIKRSTMARALIEEGIARSESGPS